MTQRSPARGHDWRRRPKTRGRPRPQNDMWIAACCIRHGLPLVTLNTKDFADFSRYDGLVLLSNSDDREPPPQRTITVMTRHYREALRTGATLGLRGRPHVHWAQPTKDEWLESMRSFGWRILAVEL